MTDFDTRTIVVDADGDPDAGKFLGTADWISLSINGVEVESWMVEDGAEITLSIESGEWDAPEGSDDEVP